MLKATRAFSMTGQTVSHYRVLEKLGQGGMGAVYQAEDLTLRRQVALKFISGGAMEDREFRVRFVREAQSAASLHHPNICTVFELDEERGFLALELIEGPSLRERIRERPLKLDEALRIATEVAEGLKAAHAAGVVHRDIKSGNILLDASGRAKITDFGLATLSDSTRVTKTGTAVGTPGSMAPEQARGEKADRRTDLWALGVVLYEMVSGKLPFAGESDAAVVHAILHDEPEPLTALRAGLPVELDRVVGRCLAKDPGERYQHADDLLVDLRRLSRPSVTTAAGKAARKKRQSWGWVVAGALAVALAGSVSWQVIDSHPGSAAGGPVRRFQLEAEFDPGKPGTTDTVMPPAISPDGTMVAFVKQASIWIRDLDRLEARKLAGTEGGGAPFWSPDSSQVAYWTGSALKRVPARGGEPVLLGETTTQNLLGGTWGTRGTILLGLRGGIYSIPEKGGQLKLALAADRNLGEQDFHRPVFLPDGESFIYAVHPFLDFSYYLSIRSRGKSRRLTDAKAGAATVAALDPAGYLVYERLKGDKALFAVPFSFDRMDVTGEPVSIAAGAGGPSVSNSGDLVHVGGPITTPYEVVVLDRSGKVLQVVGGGYGLVRAPTFSHDSRRVALMGVPEAVMGIWIHDLERGSRSMLAGGAGGRRASPAWGWDDQNVVYMETVGTKTAMVMKTVDGSKPAVTLVSDADLAFADQPALSPDGRFVVYAAQRNQQHDLVLAEVRGLGKARALLATPADERNPQISPDGRYLAYASDESGKLEIYVRRFPDGGERWVVSSGGGTVPYWSGRGDELFFLRGNVLMAAQVSGGTQFRAGVPRELFDGDSAGVEMFSFAIQQTAYGVSPDGQRIVTVRRSGRGKPVINFVENWKGLLGAR
ncbi:MAG: protein kinase [Acidobacteria bacterium]|nr:protein kinase [Acidobacteriota bacterium]